MTLHGLACRPVTGLVLGLAIAGVAGHAQEPLTVAKTHYASAAYEEALLALAAVRPVASSPEAAEAAAYRAYCLLALGRTDDARAAVESLVLLDPLFRPDEEQTSPRVRAFFDDVRTPMLGEVVWQRYASAREAYGRQDLTAAAADFGRVVRLIGEIPEPVDAKLLDLRALAAGFMELIDETNARVEAQRAEAVTPAPSAASGSSTEPAGAISSPPAVPAEPDPDRVYTEEDAGVVRPAVISRPLPPWIPPAGAAGQKFSGVLEVIVGPDGKVESALMRESIYPLYDSLLLSATRAWQFQPATRNGEPVRYLYRLAVKMGD